MLALSRVEGPLRIDCDGRSQSQDDEREHGRRDERASHDFSLTRLRYTASTNMSVVQLPPSLP